MEIGEGKEKKTISKRGDEKNPLDISGGVGETRIASINTGSLNVAESFRRLTDLLKTKRIDIACID